MDEWTPVPHESGSLEPPRRHPPTAVGVATPPPPRHNPAPRRSRFPRLGPPGRAFLGFLSTFTGGVAIGSFLPEAAAMIAVAGCSALLVTFQLRRRRARRLRTYDRSPLYAA